MSKYLLKIPLYYSGDISKLRNFMTIQEEDMKLSSKENSSSVLVYTS